MTLSRRIARILSALLEAMMAVVLFVMGEAGFWLMCLLLSLTLILFGARNVLFYFTMARHMVNGKSSLILGVIALDFGFFTISVADHEGVFIALYLLGAYAFYGVVDILRAKEAKQFEAPSWRMNLAMGIADIGVAAAAAVFGLFAGNIRDLTLIYAVGLVYGALLNLTSVFRKTAIVYIP